MLRRKILGVFLLYAVLLPAISFGQMAAETAKAAAVYTAPKADIDKIKDEGMNRSKVMETLSYLTDVIGARLTASPSLFRANEWTRDTAVLEERSLSSRRPSHRKLLRHPTPHFAVSRRI